MDRPGHLGCHLHHYQSIQSNDQWQCDRSGWTDDSRCWHAHSQRHQQLQWRHHHHWRHACSQWQQHQRDDRQCRHASVRHRQRGAKRHGRQHHHEQCHARIQQRQPADPFRRHQRHWRGDKIGCWHADAFRHQHLYRNDDGERGRVEPQQHRRLARRNRQRRGNGGKRPNIERRYDRADRRQRRLPAIRGNRCRTSAMDGNHRNRRVRRLRRKPVGQPGRCQRHAHLEHRRTFWCRGPGFQQS